MYIYIYICVSGRWEDHRLFSDAPGRAVRLFALLRHFQLPREGNPGSGFRVKNSGFRVQGSGFRVQGSGFRVQSSSLRVQGSGLRVEA